jgi:serine/threonine protein kinase
MAAIELAPGAALGEGARYRLERVLGTGGMASVWLATDARLEREVAVKVLSDALALDASYVLRFEREARVAAGLSHPHLVSVFDFSVDGPRPYLVMEYIAGGSLADRLRDPEAGAWHTPTLARGLLDALAHIHGAGVVHRDIKPANVLIGADGRARLTDFGIAQPSGATQLTRTGVVIGSGRFIAPEVMRGEPANERSDLYSLGVLIEQCLVGRTPDAQAPPQLRALVSGLMATRPEQRPGSASDAMNILDSRPTVPTQRLDNQTARTEPTRLMDGATATTRRRSRATSPRRIKLRPSRSSLMTMAVIVVLVIVLIALTAPGGGGSPTEASAPARANPNAPLSSELSQLDRAIDQSHR